MVSDQDLKFPFLTVSKLRFHRTSDVRTNIKFRKQFIFSSITSFKTY